MRPRQVEKGIRLHGQPGCGHALRQIRQVGGIAGNCIQVCILGQRYGPRAAGAADRHHGTPGLQQPAAQCCAHGPGGAGYDYGFNVTFYHHSLLRHQGDKHLLFQLFPRQIISVFGNGNELYYQFATSYFRVFLFFTFLNCFE